MLKTVIDIALADPVAFASGVVAFIALAAAIWQGWVTRRHNRLSVTPQLRLDVDTTDGEPIRIPLVNCGIGPAIIECFIVKVDCKPVDGNRQERMEKALQMLDFNDSMFDKKPVFYAPSQQEAIAAGDKHELLVLSVKQEARKQVESALPRLQFYIRYKSFYEEGSELRGPEWA